MERQLVLIGEAPDWRIDDTTREEGRRGLAAARAELRDARRRAAAARRADAAGDTRSGRRPAA